MFNDLWPDGPVPETPITSVTNGVHAGTWVAPELSDLLTRYVLPGWDEADEQRWARLDDARDDALRRAREQGREAMVCLVRSRWGEQPMARGTSSVCTEWHKSHTAPKPPTARHA